MQRNSISLAFQSAGWPPKGSRWIADELAAAIARRCSARRSRAFLARSRADILAGGATFALASSGGLCTGRPSVSEAARSMTVSTAATGRSEEHTSELQSLAYLVCRLLLEKKKQNTKWEVCSNRSILVARCDAGR